MSTALVVPKFSAARLRATLQRLGVSQRELGRRISDSPESGRIQVGFWLHGHRTPSLETVYKLANALGVKVEDLCEVAE